MTTEGLCFFIEETLSLRSDQPSAVLASFLEFIGNLSFLIENLLSRLDLCYLSWFLCLKHTSMHIHLDEGEVERLDAYETLIPGLNFFS